MTRAFIPASWEAILPAVTPSEIADKLAESRGCPRDVEPIVDDDGQPVWSGEKVDLVVSIIKNDSAPVRVEAANAVLMHLRRGSLASFVDAPALGRPYRIPVTYWEMRSADPSPWSAIGALKAFPFATGFDESMIGQTVFVSEGHALALLKKFAELDNASIPSVDHHPKGARRRWRHTETARHKKLREYLELAGRLGRLDRGGDNYQSARNIHPDYRDWCGRQRPVVKPFEISRFKDLVAEFIAERLN